MTVGTCLLRVRLSLLPFLWSLSFLFTPFCFDVLLKSIVILDLSEGVSRFSLFLPSSGALNITSESPLRLAFFDSHCASDEAAILFANVLLLVPYL